jgi:hypothetical protein
MVVEEYFRKEMVKNLAQHRTDEKIMKYKLEAYQKIFLDFICGGPTSIEVRMKRQKQGLVEQLKGRMCRLRNHMTSEVE